MKIKLLKSSLILLSIYFTIVACGGKKAEKINTEIGTKPQNGLILEHIKSTSYSYLKVKIQDSEYWLAAPLSDFDVNDSIYFNEAVKMLNFTGKEINRTFEEIYFVENISNSPFDNVNISEVHSGLSEKTIETINLNPTKGSISIASVFENKDKLNGKTVKVYGKVVKVNEEIMNKNWIHLQDGSKFNNSFDLTFTTNEFINKGDTIFLEGKLTTNKDFGSGYLYDVIIEDAKIVK